MNATSNQPTTPGPVSDPWVESGAMVYVAITVATCSAVIMCCTWFITHNQTVKRWLGRDTVYNSVGGSDEEVEIQLTASKDDTEDFPDARSSPFTLEDNDDSESESSEPKDSDEDRVNAQEAV